MSQTIFAVAKHSIDASTVINDADACDMVRNAAQWLARMASSFGQAPASECDGPQVYWDGRERRFFTPEVAPHTVVELRLPAMTLQFCEKGKPSPHALDIEGKSSAEVEAWLLIEMLHRGIDRERFSKDLPYTWDRLMSGDEAKYETDSRLRELERLTTLLESASNVLAHAASLEAGGRAVACEEPLICWPKDLDIGFVLPPEAGSFGMQVAFHLAAVDAGLGFVVQSLTGRHPLDLEPLSLPFSEIVRRNLTNDEVAHEIRTMIGKMRASAAH